MQQLVTGLYPISDLAAYFGDDWLNHLSVIFWALPLGSCQIQSFSQKTAKHGIAQTEKHELAHIREENDLISDKGKHVISKQVV